MKGTREEGCQRVGINPDTKGHTTITEGASMAFSEAIAALDPDTAEAIRERAAVLEYDGGMNRTDAERTALATHAPGLGNGLEELKNFMSYDIPLIGIWPDSGASIEPWGNRDNFTRNAGELVDLWEGRGNVRGAAKGKPIRRFAFIPGESGLICLDLDRGHEDGGDGVASLRALFKGRPMPRVFADIDQGTFPAYTRTPGGGFHLFFRYTGTKKYGPQSIAPGLEVVHFNHTLTAPGSERGTGRYDFFGSLEKVTAFPPVLEWTLTPTAEYRAPKLPKPVFSDPTRKARGTPSLDKLADWAMNDGNYSGRNDLCHGIARRAAKKEYHYSREEVKTFLRSFGPVEGLPTREIETAVDSAFNHKGRA